MISCRRPANRPGRLTGPSGPSKRYSFCTAIHGIRRRLAASASRARVSFFSSTSNSWRAASHSCGDTIGGVFIVACPPSGTRRRCRTGDPTGALALHPVRRFAQHSGLQREPVGPAPIVRRSTPVGLGVLTNALAAANDVVERDVHHGPLEVDVADLQIAQLTASHQPAYRVSRIGPRTLQVGRVGLEPTTGGL